MDRTRDTSKGRALLDALAVMVGRFLLMWGVVALTAGLGWYAGLLSNLALAIAACALVTRRRLWVGLGPLRPPAGVVRAAALPLLVLAADAVLWGIPGGIAAPPPGWAPWILTLVLVGINEELFTRGVVLASLERAFSAGPAAVLSGVIFGVQHFSNLVLTSRGVLDVTENVLLSSVVGVAYAAFMVRHRWIWPLVLVHALADLVTIFALRPPPDAVVVADHVVLLGLAVILLRRRPAETRYGEGPALR